MNPQSTHPAAEILMAWDDQEVSPDRAAEISAHVQSCAACRARVADAHAAQASARAWRIEPAPATIRAAVLAAAGGVATAPSAGASRNRPASWKQFRWQAAAAVGLVAAGLVVAQVTVCGTAMCYISAPHATSEGQGISAATEPAPNSGSGTSNLELWWRSRPRVDLGIEAQGVPVVAVWLVDYECPACRVSDPTYTAFLEEYAASHPGDVRIVVVDWPWNSDCNPNVPTTFPGHEASCAAAVAMKLASERGTGTAMKTWLFSHQGGATDVEVRAAAKTVAGVTDFGERYPDELRQLRARLQALGPARISSTPGCYINGVRAADEQGHLLPTEVLGRLLDIERRK